MARGLGPSGKGEFAFYSWGVSVGVVLLGGGWHGAAATIASEGAREGTEAVRIGRRRLLPAIAALAIVALSCALAGSSGWALVATATALQIWGQPASGALVGVGSLRWYYGGVLTQSVSVLCGLTLLWNLTILTPESAMAVLVGGVVCGMFVHNGAAGAGFGPSRAPAAPHPRLTDLARDVWLADLASFLTYRLDFIIVRQFTGPQGLGLYSTATSVAELGRMAPNAVGQAALRELGRAPTEQRRDVARRAIAVGLPASALFLGALSVAAPWLIPRLYGRAFAPAGLLVPWLAPGIALLAVASVAASWLGVSGRSRDTARLAWWTCVASALMSLTLVAGLGLTGAAIASSLEYALLAALAWRSANRRLKTEIPA
jgi:O-antigen/teichoic acid export membrane protein